MDEGSSPGLPAERIATGVEAGDDDDSLGLDEVEQRVWEAVQ
jgi:hypothetical protein